jgi:hypothetical protein
MVRNFNNFKAFVMFAVKKIGSLANFGRKILSMLMLVRKKFLIMLMLVGKIFFYLLPTRQHFREKICTTWSKS